MFIEFDPIKEASNSAKHGVSLAEAEELDWDSMVIKRIDRRERGAQRRVISLRKANQRGKD